MFLFTHGLKVRKAAEFWYDVLVKKNEGCLPAGFYRKVRKEKTRSAAKFPLSRGDKGVCYFEFKVFKRTAN